MANLFPVGSPWDPYRYANTFIEVLYKALGLARAVYRGFDTSPAEKGSTIRIPKPQTFSVQDMPISSAEELKPGWEDLVVDQWKGVLMGMTDKELTFSKEGVIEKHIEPAAYEVADAIDQSLAAKILHIPWYYEVAASAAVKDITQLRRVLNENYVRKGMRFLAINDEREAGFLELGTFHEADKSAEGDRVQREGDLGRKFGFDIFSNQNIPNHVAGALSPGTQAQLNANYTKGTTQIVIKITKFSCDKKTGAPRGLPRDTPVPKSIYVLEVCAFGAIQFLRLITEAIMDPTQFFINTDFRRTSKPNNEGWGDYPGFSRNIMKYKEM